MPAAMFATEFVIALLPSTIDAGTRIVPSAPGAVETRRSPTAEVRLSGPVILNGGDANVFTAIVTNPGPRPLVAGSARLDVSPHDFLAAIESPTRAVPLLVAGESARITWTVRPGRRGVGRATVTISAGNVHLSSPSLRLATVR